MSREITERQRTWLSEELDAWSADGKWLYFASAAADPGGNPDIWRVSAEGGTPIEVSREGGRAALTALDAAIPALRGGDLVGVYPEATISRSFELKEFKTGASRMALEAQVPLKVRMQVGSFDMVCRMVEQGVGIGVLPYAAVLSQLQLPSVAVGQAITPFQSNGNWLVYVVSSRTPVPIADVTAVRGLG